jgi:hypothetical protein
MPRKAATKTAENTTQAIANALDTPLNLDWDATAEPLGLTIPELQERMAAKLDATVFAWANIPAEHQSVVNAIARDLESEASVRRFDAPSETTAELPPVVEPPILQDDFQQSAITEAPLPNDLTNGIAQDLQDTQQAVDETLELQDLLFAAEADDKAQLAAAVKKHGWQIYQRVGAEIDVATILEIAQSKLNAADGVTNSRLANLAERLGVKTPEQIRKEVAQRKEAFFAQQQQRQTAWKSATSSQT